MFHVIKSISTRDNLILKATFLNGTVKEYDVTNLLEMYPQMRALENKILFNNVQIDVGGYGISWNDELDLDSETIWEYGITVEKVKTTCIMDIATKLSEARDRAGMTQKDLSEKTGIYQAEISKLERGIGNPSLNTLQRLAEGLGVELKIDFQ